jgi:LPXTG-motif cell wall-anchored protein
MKTMGLMMLLVGAAGSAVAAGAVVPEIDSASSVGALVLLSGALLVIRSRRKK